MGHFVIRATLFLAPDVHSSGSHRSALQPSWVRPNNAVGTAKHKRLFRKQLRERDNKVVMCHAEPRPDCLETDPTECVDAPLNGKPADLHFGLKKAGRLFNLNGSFKPRVSESTRVRTHQDKSVVLR